jgi:hypothetical protein
VRWVLWVVVALVAYMALLTLGMATALSGSAVGDVGGATQVAGIPPGYLVLYRRAATATGLDWSILAAVGEVETDHGRAQGGRCATSSAGARGPMQFMPATWANYGAGGDVCDPADAIPAAARYLVASGAPGDYHAAILSYNHSEAYYESVVEQARRYRSAAGSGGGVQVGPVGSSWLAVVPGTTFECDRRIVPDVVVLIERYHLQLTACYAPTGHAADGEHPLGLAVDVVPAPPASWGAVDKMALDVGWVRSCGASGVRPACPLRPWVRFVGYDGYEGHGRGNHLHLSWAHGPGRPAAWVRVMSSG